MNKHRSGLSRRGFLGGAAAALSSLPTVGNREDLCCGKLSVREPAGFMTAVGAPVSASSAPGVISVSLRGVSNAIPTSGTAGAAG